MDREQEVIHKQMEDTRAGLTDKLAALETKVSGTVQTATDAVETTKEAVTGTVQAVTGTVETVKETVADVSDKLQETVAGVTETVQEAVAGVKESVQETFQSVAETFNLKAQAERHPWAVFGGAVAVGALGGYLLGGSSRESRQSSWLPEAKATGNGTHAAPEQSQSADQSGGVGGWLWEQLGGLRGMALGAMMGVVRDLVVQAVPETVKERVTEEVNKLTTSLGGEPLKESLFQPHKDEPEDAQERGKDFQHDAGNMGRTESASARTGQPILAKSRR
jgi:ElaB/YqjD/DUF883 family membrane-anchored ribosome-binding protein